MHTPVLLSVADRGSVEIHSRSQSSVTNLVPMRSGSSFLRGVLRYLDAGDLREEHVRVEIRVVRPAYGAQFRIHACLGEERGLAERLEHAGELNHLRHVNNTLGAIIESDAKPMIGERLDRNHISQ